MIDPEDPWILARTDAVVPLAFESILLDARYDQTYGKGNEYRDRSYKCKFVLYIAL